MASLFKVTRLDFLGGYLPSLSNYVGMSKDMGKTLPQNINISYDLGFIAIWVTIAA